MNNFGDILDRWISVNGIQNKDVEEKDRQDGAQEKRRRLRNKKPDAELDIHGKTRDEAWLALDVFFNNAREKGYEKILVIHGKGNHSQSEAVLKRVVMDFVERCPFAGESGRGKPTRGGAAKGGAASGGEGATWVLLKETKEGT